MRILQLVENSKEAHLLLSPYGNRQQTASENLVVTVENSWASDQLPSRHGSRELMGIFKKF